MATVALYNTDCLNTLDELVEDSIDLVITDPPYNLGIFMKERDTNLSKMRDNFFVSAGWDNMEQNDWILFMDNFFSKLSRVMKVKSSVIMFMSIIRLESVINIAKKHGFYYKTTGIWHKKNPMPRNMNLHFINSTESWIYFTYKSKTGTFNNNGKVIHDFIETGITPKSEKIFGKHPTQKPEALISFFIQTLSNKEDTILDPFMGSGTTGVCCKNNGRNFVGVEIDKEYFEIASRRIENEH